MSSEALAWAFKVDVKPSSLKFTLVALCECANYQTGRIHPSIAHISEITGQNRKTVIANIAALEAKGLIVATGEKSGRTNQINVYEARLGTVPKTEQSQKRNSSAFPPKQSQKRDTEPSREPSVLAKAKPLSAREQIIIPDWMPIPQWEAYLKMRKAIRKPPTSDAVKLLIGKLERWRANGHDPGAILDNSTENSWAGIFEPKAKSNGNTNRQRSAPVAGSNLSRAIAEGLEFLG